MLPKEHLDVFKRSRSLLVDWSDGQKATQRLACSKVANCKTRIEEYES